MTTTRDPSALCTATKASTGARCTAYALAGQPTCYMHSPGAQHGRRKASSAPPPVPGDITAHLPMTTHAEIRRAMEIIVNAVRDGSLPSRSALAMIQGARLALASVNEDRDRQIAELRQLIADRQPHTTRPRRR